MVQIPNGRKAFWSFEIEIWDLFGIWNLASGISTLFGSGYAGLGYWINKKALARGLPRRHDILENANAFSGDTADDRLENKGPFGHLRWQEGTRMFFRP